tara:strand:- start:41244 stop:43364 length:2121 start_codon:yes stop_codon:yes gene_type:complete
MAVLNKIRQRSVFLIIIIALALFSFVLADVIQNGGFSSQKEMNTIATVNGTDINRNEFVSKVENALRNLGPEASSLQAVNLVWNNELRSVLLKEQFEELGLEVSDAQLQNALAQNLAGNPSFTNEAGRFDNNKLQEYLADVKVNAPELYNQFVEFERNVAQNAKEQTYFNLIRAGLGATSAEGQMEYKLENDKVDIDFIQIPYSNISDEEVNVTEADIADYIKRNAEKYETDAAIDIQYVLFSEDPSSSDEEEIKGEITSLLNQQISYNAVSKQNDTLPGFSQASDNAAFVAQHSDSQYNDRWWFKNQLPEDIADTLYNLNVGEVFGPYKSAGSYNLYKVIESRQLADSVQAKHILIAWDGLQTAGETSRTKEEAQSLADSLLSVVIRDASKFETLAGEFSDDPSVAENNGDLGYLPPNSTVEAFDNFIFNNKSGDKAVVETDFGYHVISIEDQKNIQKAIKVARVAKSIQPSEETLNQVFTNATKFESRAKNSDFVEASKEESLTVRPVNRITELEENIPGIGNNRPIVNWAFEKETKVGDIKRFDVTNGYAIVQLTGKTQKGLMPVSEASVTVTPLVRNEKKAQKIRESITGNTLEEIASGNNTQVKRANALNRKSPTIPDAGSEPKVVGAAFGLNEGQTSQLIDGKNGVYKVRVVTKREAQDVENYSAYITQINSRRTAAVSASVFNALKKKADIEDRRANFY